MTIVFEVENVVASFKHTKSLDLTKIKILEISCYSYTIVSVFSESTSYLTNLNFFKCWRVFRFQRFRFLKVGSSLHVVISFYKGVQNNLGNNKHKNVDIIGSVEEYGILNGILTWVVILHKLIRSVCWSLNEEYSIPSSL